jgi:hypothetical protein
MDNACNKFKNPNLKIDSKRIRKKSLEFGFILCLYMLFSLVFYSRKKNTHVSYQVDVLLVCMRLSFKYLHQVLSTSFFLHIDS